MGDILYTKADLIIRRCVREYELFDMLKSCHDESCGGNFVDKGTTYKVLRLRYYWPNLFRDAEKYVRSFDSFQ
jgi:hypothetical protein